MRGHGAWVVVALLLASCGGKGSRSGGGAGAAMGSEAGARNTGAAGGAGNAIAGATSMGGNEPVAQGGEGGEMFEPSVVCEGDRTISTRPVFEAFLATRCSEVTGTLTFVGIPGMKSLEGLERLTHVGSLNIQTTELSGLEGLSNLVKIDDSLKLDRNEQLESIAALSSLSPGPLAGDLFLYVNPKLTSLEPLHVISGVEGSLTVYFCDALTTLAGLEGVTSVGKNLSVGHDLALTSVAALAQLKQVPGDFEMTSNPVLTSLLGLDQLESVGGLLFSDSPVTTLSDLQKLSKVSDRLWLTLNPQLQAFDLPALAEVGTVRIDRNQKLTKLTGLKSLDTIDGDLVITGNDALGSLADVSNLTTVAKELQIDNNGKLTSLIGLEQLAEVESVIISGNAALKSLDGLGTAPRLTLAITDNPVLTSLQALQGVTTLEGQLLLSHNEALAALTGLGALTRAGDVAIDSNPALASLAGLSALLTVDVNFSIFDNDKLTGLTGLSTVKSVGGTLTIAENDVLASLVPLGAWPADAVLETIEIFNNPKLSQCEVDELDLAQLEASCVNCAGNASCP